MPDKLTSTVVIQRRRFLVGASAALVSAPSIVRAASLMPVRSIVSAAEHYHYGFVDRLWIDHRFRSGQLTGAALTRAIERGLLNHVL